MYLPQSELEKRFGLSHLRPDARLNGVQSANNVSIDGVSRRILDIRTVRRPSIGEAHPVELQGEANDEQVRKPLHYCQKIMKCKYK